MLQVLIVEERQLVHRGLRACLEDMDNFTILVTSGQGARLVLVAATLDDNLAAEELRRFGINLCLPPSDTTHHLAVNTRASLAGLRTLYRPGCVKSETARGALTTHEHAILGLLATGFRSKEIGRKLCISPETVRFHLDNACFKLGARSRAHAVAEAVRRRLIDCAHILDADALERAGVGLDD